MTDLKLVEPSAIYKDAYLDMRQMNYWGIVIEQSLKDGSVLEDFDLLAKKQIGGWTFRLVSVPEHEMEAKLAKLQRHMIDVREDCWYAHFFKDETMFVVYQDRVFKTSVDPDGWREAVEHGLRNGVPLEQLDFKPRTKDAAEAFFGLRG